MNVNPRTYEAYQLLHDGTLALTRAEQQGIRVDLEYITNQKAHLTNKIERLERQFKETNLFKHWEHSQKGKVNIHSNSQLAHFLYDVKKLKKDKETESGQGSTDDDSLKGLGIPELNNLLDIRKLKKVRDTYLDAFAREQVNGYIHPFFNLHLVRTFRSSSDSPNFQNIPKRDEEAMKIVRRALYPRPGHQLVEVDFSGLEVRIAACYNKDTNLLKYIKDPKSDMHRDMAQQIFLLDKYDKEKHYVLRQAAKNGFVFPEFYGDYYINCATNMACGWGKLPQGTWNAGQGILIGDNNTLGMHLISNGITSLNKFEKHVKEIEKDFWENRFPEYAEWKDRWYNTYKKYGYIDLLTGFRCSGVMSRNEVINTPVQGAAFHCLLWSFIEMDKTISGHKWDSKLIGQIHDSMILDVNPDELNVITSYMRKITCEDLPKAWSWIIVPMDIEIEACPVDGSWAEKEKVIIQ
jgi:DNA polymerase I